MGEGVVRKDELEASIEARKELGEELEPALVDAYVGRIERRLSERKELDEKALKRRREHQKEMVLGSMGVGVPLLLIAVIFTGFAGVLVVSAAVALIAVVSAIRA